MRIFSRRSSRPKNHPPQRHAPCWVGAAKRAECWQNHRTGARESSCSYQAYEAIDIASSGHIRASTLKGGLRVTSCNWALARAEHTVAFHATAHARVDPSWAATVATATSASAAISRTLHSAHTRSSAPSMRMHQGCVRGIDASALRVLVERLLTAQECKEKGLPRRCRAIRRTPAFQDSIGPVFDFLSLNTRTFTIYIRRLPCTTPLASFLLAFDPRTPSGKLAHGGPKLLPRQQFVKVADPSAAFKHSRTVILETSLEVL